MAAFNRCFHLLHFGLCEEAIRVPQLKWVAWLLIKLLLAA
jgi:hypothetical protein